jgi:putative transposase
MELDVLRYDSDLTDREWEIISPIFMRANKGRHFQKHNKRELVNAVRYLSKTGCQWRLLPKEYPSYKTVSSFYVRALKSGLWEEMMDLLVQKTRLNAGRNVGPSYSLIDSQSVKTVSASDERGIDGGKKSKAANDT